MRYFLSVFVVFIFITIACKNNQSIKPAKGDLESSPRLDAISFPSNGFNSALLDQDGSIWFGSNGGGLYHYDGNSFAHYTEKDGLSSNQIYAMILDNDNNLWLGTQEGLTKYNKKEFIQIRLPYQDTAGWLSSVYPVLSPNAAHTLAVDDDDNLWIGTGGAGVYKYDGSKFNSHLTDIGLIYNDDKNHNWVSFIRKDLNGNVWFASMSGGGVSKYDGSNFIHFSVDDGLSDQMVRTIYCDSEGRIWIGFNGNRKSALTVYDHDVFESYTLEDRLCNQRIRTIYEDKSGRLWLGSHLGNLCVFNGAQFEEFNYEGRIFPDILFVTGDAEDNVWFGGSHGIWKYDGEKLIEIISE